MKGVSHAAVIVQNRSRRTRRRIGRAADGEVADAGLVAIKVLLVMGYSPSEIHRALRSACGSLKTTYRRCERADGLVLDVDPGEFFDLDDEG